MRPRLTLGLLAATGAVLAGCTSVPDGARDAQAFECPLGEEGCDVNEPVGPGGEMTVVSSREGEFSFTVEDGLAVTGEIEVAFVNEGAGVHNVEAIGASDGSDIPEAEGGAEDDGMFLLFPGEWTIICNIPGHQASGMEATVQVFATEEELEAAEAEGIDPNEGDEDDAAGGGGGGGEGGGEQTIDDI